MYIANGDAKPDGGTNMPEFLTCTQKLQEWNKSCARKVDPIAVEDVRSHQQVIFKILSLYSQ